MISTAGRWDKNNRNVYFLAAAADEYYYISILHKYILIAVNQIANDFNSGYIDNWIDEGFNILIDSGAFSLLNEHRKTNGMSYNQAAKLSPKDIIGYQDLLDTYIEVMKRYGDSVWGYIELDIGGTENKRQTRKMLEGLGLKPIPVYHPLSDDVEYFDELAENYDRICIGGIALEEKELREKIIATIWERHRKYPELWVHLLGYTPNEWMNAFPIDSCDSSSWLSSTKWSGYKPRAMLAGYGKMPKNFQYKIGMSNSTNGYIQGRKMATYAAHMNQLNWHNYIASLKEIGFDIYPEKEGDAEKE